MRKALGLVAVVLISALAGSCKKQDKQAEAPVPVLASHRAIYDLSMGHATSKSQVNDVSGRLVIEWQDACEGYTTNQRFVSQFGNVDGGSILSDMTVSSWESTDGSRFRFSVMSTVNGKPDERSRGEGRRDLKTGSASVSFDEPSGKTLDLPTGTLFPTEHMVRLLQAAQGGQHMFTAPMFDGSFAQGTSDVSAFIAKPLAAAEPDKSIEADDTARKLLAGPALPIRMAFFPIQNNKPQEVPDYEFEVKLHDNGVAGALEFDYGEFTVLAKLTKIEALPGCEPAAKPKT